MQQLLAVPMDFQKVRDTLVGLLAKNLGLQLRALKSE
jgi:hypothetical protein